jgi:hypothetical protein
MSTEFPETFDPTQEQGNVWDLLPPGEYVAQAIEATVAPPKSGNGYMLTLVWKILEGEYENRQIWQTVTFLHSNEVAQSIGRKTVKDLCDATGVESAVRDASLFLFKPVKIRIGIEKDKNGIYDDKNKITRILPLDPNGTAPAAETAPPPEPRPKPAPAAASAARAPAAASARPAGNAPWHRAAAR